MARSVCGRVDLPRPGAIVAPNNSSAIPEGAWSATYEFSVFFFFNDRATPEIYPLSLHDPLPICPGPRIRDSLQAGPSPGFAGEAARLKFPDRKSTRLNSSHLGISYAVFCLK